MHAMGQLLHGCLVLLDTKIDLVLVRNALVVLLGRLVVALVRAGDGGGGGGGGEVPQALVAFFTSKLFPSVVEAMDDDYQQVWTRCSPAGVGG